MHLLTPCPNMLISLIDQFRISNGWMDGQPGGPMGGGGCQARPPEYRIRTLDQYILSFFLYCNNPHTHVQTGTYVLALADGWTYMYMNRRQTRRQVIYNMLLCIIMDATGTATAYTCMLMHRHSGCIIHEHATPELSLGF